LDSTSSRFSDPIQKITIVDTLARRIRKRILHNEFTAGEQLRQEALADAYGVSRMPIREALRQLEAEGLVIFNPHKGVIVSAMSLAEAEELFDLRLLIEPDLITRSTRMATPKDHRAARKALDICNDTYDNGDITHWGETNSAFHECLYRPAGRTRSLGLVQSLNANIDRYVRLQLSLDDQAPEQAHREHDALFQLFQSGDADGARAALTTHIAVARQKLIDALQDRVELED
jgi:DNA-binding GntR family transcriptional regulator